MCPRLTRTAIGTEGAWSLQRASCTDTLHHLSRRRPGLLRQREWHQTKNKTLTELLVPNAQRDSRGHCLQNIPESTRRETSDAVMSAHRVRITTDKPGYPEKTRQRSSRRSRRKKTLNHQGLQVSEMKTKKDVPQSQGITQKATVLKILLATFSFNNSGTNQDGLNFHISESCKTSHLNQQIFTQVVRNNESMPVQPENESMQVPTSTDFRLN